MEVVVFMSDQASTVFFFSLNIRERTEPRINHVL